MHRRIALPILLLGLALSITTSGLAAPRIAPQAAPRAAGTVGTAFTFQGYLTQNGGPANGSHDFEFSLYDAAEDGNQVGDTLFKGGVTVSDGQFTVILDFGEVYDGAAYWLEIAVRQAGVLDFTSLSPRRALSSAPYAQALPGLYTIAGVQSPSLVGGYRENLVDEGVQGAAIGGGGEAAKENRVTDAFGAIAGGAANQAGDALGGTLDAAYAAVGGGTGNQAKGSHSVVAGGAGNAASAAGATVAGGESNAAGAAKSAVGGGVGNAASAEAATVAGGDANTASGAAAAVGGGTGNTAGQDAATVAGGQNNSAAAPKAAVGGGIGNGAAAEAATVAGGEANNATAPKSAVGGGKGNSASAEAATVAGGDGNAAGGLAAAVGGGKGNTASHQGATVAGGEANSATAVKAAVGGGKDNAASAEAATVAGGDGNAAGGLAAAVGGGKGNTAGQEASTIAGGDGNFATAARSAVGGGKGNSASAEAATVAGGESNAATGAAAAVPGGKFNQAGGDWSFAAGQRAKANHDGSFVWADSTAADYASTGANQFQVRATGGVSFDTAGAPVKINGVEVAAGGSPYANVVIVAKSGGDYTSIQTALDNIFGAGAGNRYLVWVAPGVYNETVTMKPYVDIEGAGQGLVTITYTGGPNVNTGTVIGSDNAELRDLTVENTGGDINALGIVNYGKSPTITRVTARASGGTDYNFAVHNRNAASPTITDVTAIAEGGTSQAAGVYANGVGVNPVIRGLQAYGSGANASYGLYLGWGQPTIVDVTAEAWGGNHNLAIYSQSTSYITITNVTAVGTGGTTSGGVYVGYSDASLTNVIAIARDGTTSNTALSLDSNATHTQTLVNVSGTANGGGGTNYGLKHYGVDLTINNSTLKAIGGTDYGFYTGGGVGSGYVVRINNSQITAGTNTLRGQADTTILVGASQLDGGPVDANGGPLTCAGVYDEAYTFYASTCP